MTTKTEEKKEDSKKEEVSDNNGTDSLDNILAAEMAEAGVLYGHKKSKTHPKMKPFIAANRYELEIMDPGSVDDSLQKAIKVMKKVLADNGTILFVGTTSQSREVIKETAEMLGCPYITTRWLGGTLTNFKVIKGRIDHYLELQKKQEEGELEKYTKKEQADFDKEISKLSKFFSGLTGMKKKPDMVFTVDIDVHEIVAKETAITDTPLVAIVDTNDDPSDVDHPIIANDHTRSSIEWIMERIKSGLVKSVNKEEPKKAENKEEEPKKDQKKSDK